MSRKDEPHETKTILRPTRFQVAWPYQDEKKPEVACGECRDTDAAVVVKDGILSFRLNARSAGSPSRHKGLAEAAS